MTARAVQVDSWFYVERGITVDTLEAFGIETSEDRGGMAKIPYGGVTKTRTGILSGERRFFWEAGIQPRLFLQPDEIDQPKAVFLCEGETDTMRLWQELREGGSDAVVIGLPGLETWRDEFGHALSRYDRVFVILDNDNDYNVQGRADTAWQHIRHALGTKARRVRLPQGTKDICEFFNTYGLDDFKELVRVPAQQFKYNALDLSDAHIPRPVNWLVDGFIGKGDIATVIADPYAGKSMLMLDLCMAILQGRDWLGMKVNPHNNRVMYVDEENPEDVIRQRLAGLGFRNSDVPNLRYLHEQGIRLDKNPDDLLEEAVAFEPTLVILDSMAAFHTGEENNATAIRALFNNGIKPLARETGATVAVLHHTNKSTSGNTHLRVRGSGDFTASPDTVLDIFAEEPGLGQLKLSKSRRRLPSPPINFQIKTTDSGIEVVSLGEESYPF